jgi:hypothetical protein
MGIYLNSIRDDSVSISKSTMFPQATLTIGEADRKTAYSIRDAVILTTKTIGYLKDIYKQFNE